jgi:hypothetical protein
MPAEGTSERAALWGAPDHADTSYPDPHSPNNHKKNPPIAADSRVESLFAAELARRSAGGTGPEAPAVPPPPAWAARRPPSSAGGGGDADGDPPQLLASRSLSSEGLSGLIPRARALLTLGLSFSGAFAGLAALAAAAFIALAAAVGPSFVHGGREGAGPPPYVDPFQLLRAEGSPPLPLGTDGPGGAMPPPPPGSRAKKAAEAAAVAAAAEPAPPGGGGVK